MEDIILPIPNEDKRIGGNKFTHIYYIRYGEVVKLLVEKGGKEI